MAVALKRHFSSVALRIYDTVYFAVDYWQDHQVDGVKTFPTFDINKAAYDGTSPQGEAGCTIAVT